MEGNSQNNGNSQNDDNYNMQYTYENYPDYYYPQYYPAPQPQIPQGDPSAALSSMVYQLQQQTQQRQALGAMAAASISSVLGSRQQPADYHANYYGVQDQRSIINYDDLSLGNANAVNATIKETLTEENPDSPSAKKPKFCCNRWLKSGIAVAQHEKLHVKCPSCEHMCLKSALQEHEEDFHGKEKKESDKKPSRPDGIIPANAPRIETPEELEVWIAARKKNWPSKDNVTRKDQEDIEKEARGEISNKKRTANRRKDQQNAKKQKLEEKKNSLVAQYDSDSDSENDIMDPEKDAISSKDPSAVGKILLPEDRPKRRCKYFLAGRCNKGDECEFSHEKPEPKSKSKQPRAAPTFKKRPNLLFKLLEREIHQEKNVILQCLRYIVDKNYFGKGNIIKINATESSSAPVVDDISTSNEVLNAGITLLEQPNSVEFYEPVDIDQVKVCEDVLESANIVMSDQAKICDDDVPDQVKICEFPRNV